MDTLKTLIAVCSLSLTAGSAFAAQVAAPFSDSGYYLHRFLADGTTNASVHFAAPSGDHQAGLIGDEQGFLFGNDFTNSRRGYYAFDLSAVTETVTAATFRVWGWAPNGNELDPGLYRSDNASETLQLRSVDDHSASQVINAIFNDASTHTVDVPIWQDLADGDLYGSRVFSAADAQNPGLIPSPLSGTADCSNPGSGDACGRWFDIDLSDALADINNADGEWVFGASVSTIDGGPAGTSEQLFGGSVADLSDPSLQDFRAPAPQLLLTTVPIPAAVWLFATGLAGLFGATKRNLIRSSSAREQEFALV